MKSNGMQPNYMSGEVKFRGNFVLKLSKVMKTIKYKLVVKNNKPINFLAFYEFTPKYIYIIRELFHYCFVCYGIETFSRFCFITFPSFFSTFHDFFQRFYVFFLRFLVFFV